MDKSLMESEEEEVVYEGKIFEMTQRKVGIDNQEKTFEIARRSPGVRLVIVENEKILIVREFRNEIKGFDYRLPGGKVFDSLEEYKNNAAGDIMSFAAVAAKRECREETGLIAKSVDHYVTANAGATVEWDLLYFIVDDFERSLKGQELEAGEEIYVEWRSAKEIVELIKSGSMKEYRSVGVLLRFLLENGYL